MMIIAYQKKNKTARTRTLTRRDLAPILKSFAVMIREGTLN
ncbi:hypothetical protein KKC1_10110 [Calderihabitans maritimus]|uniref:Uncharacterized protein n=1 Tax=Calderihabitans maritimus TaxID=1246530 RepID=A0A1Z5HRG0_9FIRM|nr:hypothetical protein KKC1_10110 [Calderihabitans maritimus]